jgi:peroxiredoxin
MRLPRKTQASKAAPSQTVSTSNSVLGLSAGQTAPHFAATTLYGRNVSLADYAGRSVAFMIISPCRLCQSIVHAHEALGSKALSSETQLVVISLGDLEETRAFVDETGSCLPVLVAPRASNSFIKDYQVRGVPCYCVVDAQGKIQSAGYPSLEWGAWKALTDPWREKYDKSHVGKYQQAKGGDIS